MSPCIPIKDGVVCVASGKVYQYQGWLIQFEERWGPHPLRKSDREMSQRSLKDKAYWNAFWQTWEALTQEEDMEQFVVETY